MLLLLLLLFTRDTLFGVTRTENNDGDGTAFALSTHKNTCSVVRIIYEFVGFTIRPKCRVTDRWTFSDTTPLRSSVRRSVGRDRTNNNISYSARISLNLLLLLLLLYVRRSYSSRCRYSAIRSGSALTFVHRAPYRIALFSQNCRRR